MMEKKVIWLVNKHASPLKYYATHARTIKLAENFVRRGYEVYIINASVVHNRNIDLIPDNSPYLEREYDGVKYIHIKTIRYQNNPLFRIISFFQFANRLCKYSKYFPKPDIIIHTSNIPFDTKISKCAKYYHAKYVVEVVDLWPESFVSFGLIGKSNPILKPMYAIEKRMYTIADHVVFSMEGGRQYIIDKKWDISNGGTVDLKKIAYVNNGLSLDEFIFNRDNFILDDFDLKDNTKKRVIYLGSIRFVNNVSVLLDVAKGIDDKDVLFLIFGDGNERMTIERRIKEEHIKNVKLKNKWIEPQYVPYVLSCADINLMTYRKNDIYRYGGSQNKLFLSIAAGKPICCNEGMSYSLINKYDLGVDKCMDSAEQYAQSITSLLALQTDEKKAISERAAMVAKLFDYRHLSSIYLKIL